VLTHNAYVSVARVTVSMFVHRRTITVRGVVLQCVSVSLLKKIAGKRVCCMAVCSVRVRVCVCECACVRERARTQWRGRERARAGERGIHTLAHMDVCVSVCLHVCMSTSYATNCACRRCSTVALCCSVWQCVAVPLLKRIAGTWVCCMPVSFVCVCVCVCVCLCVWEREREVLCVENDEILEFVLLCVCVVCVCMCVCEREGGGSRACSS